MKRDGFLLDMRAMPPFSMTRVRLLCFGVAHCVRAMMPAIPPLERRKWVKASCRTTAIQRFRGQARRVFPSRPMLQRHQSPAFRR